MRIAQVAPLIESVPPRMYGGTERVVHYLTEELVAMGHEVTLFASGDSVTSARLVPGSPASLRLSGSCKDHAIWHLPMLEQLFRERTRFDFVHFHLDLLHFPYLKRMALPNLTTLHGRLDLAGLPDFFRTFRSPLVSISLSQRAPLPEACWAGTVYHGLPTRGELSFHPEPGDYLAFLGRISPEKRVDRAIRIAIGAGIRIRIAAKVDAADRAYFEDKVRPLLAHPLVEFIGEIGESQKGDFLGNALALLFPIDWPEPFGLVMIEALACGTPVIAFRSGSVPEIIENGKTGLLVESTEEAIRNLPRVKQLSRQTCRKVFEKKFSAERMATSYLELYESILRIERGKAGRALRASDEKIAGVRRLDLYPGELSAG